MVSAGTEVSSAFLISARTLTFTAVGACKRLQHTLQSLQLVESPEQSISKSRFGALKSADEPLSAGNPGSSISV